MYMDMICVYVFVCEDDVKAYLVIKIEMWKPWCGLLFIHFLFGKEPIYILGVNIVNLSLLADVCSGARGIYKNNCPQIHSYTVYVNIPQMFTSDAWLYPPMLVEERMM